MDSGPQPGKKQAIRRVIGRKRNAIEPSVRELLSSYAQTNLVKSTRFRSASSVGTYFATGSEAATNLILDEALRLDKRVAIPRTERDGIRFYEFSKADELTVGRYGIKEPRPDKPVDHLDLVVVPGLAFDRLGHRLGYGKGYYDRYLRAAESFSVGLGFAFQLVERLPAEAHDIRLNALATENEMMYF